MSHNQYQATFSRLNIDVGGLVNFAVFGGVFRETNSVFLYSLDIHNTLIMILCITQSELFLTFAFPLEYTHARILMCLFRIKQTAGLHLTYK